MNNQVANLRHFGFTFRYLFMSYFREISDGMTMNAILLNTAEAAEVLRVAAITLHRWRNAGKGPPYIEMGRKVYYRPADLDRWIEEQQRQPQAPVDTAA